MVVFFIKTPWTSAASGVAPYESISISQSTIEKCRFLYTASRFPQRFDQQKTLSIILSTNCMHVFAVSAVNTIHCTGSAGLFCLSTVWSGTAVQTLTKASRLLAGSHVGWGPRKTGSVWIIPDYKDVSHSVLLNENYMFYGRWECIAMFAWTQTISMVVHGIL